MSIKLSPAGYVTVLSLGTSSPKVRGVVDLTNFLSLTTFNGGNNNLDNVTGFSNLVLLKSFTCSDSSNTLSFDVSSLPPTLSDTFNVRGTNTVSGCLSNIPLMDVFQCYGSNTINGDLQGAKRWRRFECSGSTNKIGGNLSALSATTFINIRWDSTFGSMYYDGSVSGYNKVAFTDGLRSIEVRPNPSPSVVPAEAHLATFLVDLTASTWENEKVLTVNTRMPTITNTNFPNAINAIKYLRGIGVTVSVLTAA